MAKQNFKETNNNKQNKGNKRRPRRGGSRGKSGSKEMEINVKDSQINKADVPHVKTDSSVDNDPSWYTHIHPLVNDVANFNYNIPVGTPFDPLIKGSVSYDNTGTAKLDIAGVNYMGKVVPGIMTIEVAPGIGVSRDTTSAPNIAAQQLYTIVRKANSGAVNYDKTDLMMMVIAMDSAYMLYEILLRAYRSIGKYDVNSRYMPDGLLYAQGFSPDIQKQLANFRGMLDLFCYQLGSINIPDEFDFIKRHSWMFTNVYADAQSSKAQLYMYKPAGLYVWKEGADSEPTKLKWRSWSELFHTQDPIVSLDNIQAAINDVMQPILGSGDIGTMSGDLAKAFGESGMISFQPVSQYEALSPVYSMEVIQQMMNSYIINTPLVNNDITVNYDNLKAGPYLYYAPQFKKTKWNTARKFVKHFINLKEDASPELNMVATRNVITVDYTTVKDTALILSSGTEIVTDASIWTYPTDGNHITSTKPRQTTFNQCVIQPFGTSAPMEHLTTNDFVQWADDAKSIVDASSFDNQPTRYVFFQNTQWQESGSTVLEYQGVLTDIQNYTWLDDQTIKQLNDAALLSLFYCKSYPSII